MKNIGDMAIRNVALKLVDESMEDKQIKLLCESDIKFPIQYKKAKKWMQSYAPYGYAIRGENVPQSLGVKLGRSLYIILLSFYFFLLSLLSSSFLPKKGFFKYIDWIYQSDVIIAMGGGYLITANKYSDYFGILLNILPLIIAKMYGKKMIFLPMSFGPFASQLQQEIVGSVVNNSLFMSREEISTVLVKKYNKSVVEIPDLALMEWKKHSYAHRQRYYVLTFRQTLDDPMKQDEFEKEIAKMIRHIWEKLKYKCIFIPMAFNPIEENDLVVASRIQRHLQGSSYFQIHSVKTPDEAKHILSRAKFSICNRLHSAILSSTVFTPFITISYAHKTIGFMRMLTLSEWNISMKKVKSEQLLAKLNELLQKKNYEKYILILQKKRLEVLDQKSNFQALLKENLQERRKTLYA